ncbi:MAG: glutamate-5-semialdehyde dehydrogenase [Candidatus Binataceae bacterium]|jgi:glutamate-5-semialdehyde dehydrogenase|nr:glutamate-5-semialdehyde dehydrogenase [Candidatus Binataceae bacterium]MEA2681433.1 glutamate-5-semialdehyde dehydrogenase [Candidatus Binataceae bacterium]
MSLEAEILARLADARIAARRLALIGADRKNRALGVLAGALRSSTDRILAANREDVARASAAGEAPAFVDRLALTPDRIAAMARSVEEVAALPDPVGETIAHWRRPNGLDIRQVRVPIGVVAIIYESRPNVTVDAGVLGFKAGNAVVLRGGREALSTNAVLAELIAKSFAKTDLDPHAVTFIANPDREVIQILKRQPGALDLIIPRGGNALKAALAGSTVPVLPHFDGICHTYVDRAADLQMAEEICFNAKCSRPSVCNAMETMIVHAEIAPKFLPRIADRMRAAGVELRGDDRTRAIIADARAATDEDWDTEYLDLILAIKIVDSLDDAIAFISQHGSGLADAIVTQDEAVAARFEREVDSATVYVNASTRFTDGFEFGFGAETGISTNRLHARGPMGLKELTTYKYLIEGRGQIRP